MGVNSSPNAGKPQGFARDEEKKEEKGEEGRKGRREKRRRRKS